MAQINNIKHSKHLTLKIDNSLESFVIVISKKVARLSVKRNKLRRRIKEIIRVDIKNNPEKYNKCFGVANVKNIKGVIYTRKGASELSFEELKKEVLDLFM